MLALRSQRFATGDEVGGGLGGLGGGGLGRFAGAGQLQGVEGAGDGFGLGEGFEAGGFDALEVLQEEPDVVFVGQGGGEDGEDDARGVAAQAGVGPFGFVADPGGFEGGGREDDDEDGALAQLGLDGVEELAGAEVVLVVPDIGAGAGEAVDEGAAEGVVFVAVADEDLHLGHGGSLQWTERRGGSGRDSEESGMRGARMDCRRDGDGLLLAF